MIYTFKEAFNQLVNTSDWIGSFKKEPFSTSFYSKFKKNNNKIFKDIEEYQTKAPKIKPYPLDRIDDLLLNLYDLLLKIKRIILNSKNYINLNKYEKIILKKSLKNIKKMIKMIENIKKDIDLIKL